MRRAYRLALLVKHCLEGRRFADGFLASLCERAAQKGHHDDADGDATRVQAQELFKARVQQLDFRATNAQVFVQQCADARGDSPKRQQQEIETAAKETLIPGGPKLEGAIDDQRRGHSEKERQPPVRRARVRLARSLWWQLLFTKPS